MPWHLKTEKKTLQLQLRVQLNYIHGSVVIRYSNALTSNWKNGASRTKQKKLIRTVQNIIS